MSNFYALNIMPDYESDVSILGASPYVLKEKEEVLLSRVMVAKVLLISLKYSLLVSVCCCYSDANSVKRYLENYW